MVTRVLSLDLGASSGRAMLGEFDGNTLTLRELHRFSNDPVLMRGTLYWDIPKLFYEIRQSIAAAVHAGGFDAIGIDTWGVDFGLLDEYGELIGNPVHYRDSRTAGMEEAVAAVLSKEALYAATGIQHMRINTVYQLAYLVRHRPEQLARAKRLLLIPDLLAYLLTGEARCEITNASTTSLFNSRTNDWASDVLEALHIPSGLFAPLIHAGEPYGILSKELCEEFHCRPVPVIAVATHDTASAVVSVPAKDDDYAYISSGTWSLMGIESAEPILIPEAAKANFTNEIGFGGKIRFLKNIMGLWLIQEARRQWIREGQTADFDTLEREALKAPAFRSFIDPDAPDFESPGDMPARIRSYCERTRQPVPQGRGEIMRCIYESLALKYRVTLKLLEQLAGHGFGRIHIIGGGIKDTLLCRMTADACGKPVFAGPAEATAMGNAAVQLIALGRLTSLEEARAVNRRSVEPVVYTPEGTQQWQEAYQRYRKLLSLD